MKRRLLKNLIVLSCIATLLITGCGKNNEGTDPNPTDVVVDTTDVPSEDDNLVEGEDENKEDAATSKDEEVLNEDNKDELEDDEKESESEGEAEDTDLDADSTDSGTPAGTSGSSGTSTGSGSSTGSGTGSGTGATTHTHTYNDGVVTRTATCAVVGIKTYTCSCGDSYSVEIPKAAHTYYLGYCSVCNAADPSYVETYTYEVVLETGMLDLVNNRRASLGTGGLTWDSTMDEVAKIRARQLADNFNHSYEYPYTELITCYSGYMSSSGAHNNYVNSTAHDRELHQGGYSYLSSATCYKKDSRGNVVATFNIVLLNLDTGGSICTPGGGAINPDPPSDDDIIW